MDDSTSSTPRTLLQGFMNVASPVDTPLAFKKDSYQVKPHNTSRKSLRTKLMMKRMSLTAEEQLSKPQFSSQPLPTQERTSNLHDEHNFTYANLSDVSSATDASISDYKEKLKTKKKKWGNTSGKPAAAVQLKVGNSLNEVTTGNSTYADVSAFDSSENDTIMLKRDEIVSRKRGRTKSTMPASQPIVKSLSDASLSVNKHNTSIPADFTYGQVDLTDSSHDSFDVAAVKRRRGRSKDINAIKSKRQHKIDANSDPQKVGQYELASLVPDNDSYNILDSNHLDSSNENLDLLSIKTRKTHYKAEHKKRKLDLPFLGIVSATTTEDLINNSEVAVIPSPVVGVSMQRSVQNADIVVPLSVPQNSLVESQSLQDSLGGLQQIIRHSPRRSVLSSPKVSPSKLSHYSSRSPKHIINKTSILPVAETRNTPQNSVNGVCKSPQKSVDELRKSPRKSVDELRKSPQKSVGEARNTPQKSVDEAQKTPQKLVDEAQKTPQKSVYETRKAAQKSVGEASKSPQKSVDEARKALQKSVDEARKSPQKSVDEARKSPQKSVDEARKSPQKSVNEARKSPQKSVGEARKSPQKSMDEARKSPQKSVDEARKSPQKSVDEARKSPQKSVDEARRSHQKSVDEARKSPQKSVDEARKSPQKSVDEARKSPQKSVDEARKSPQKSVDEARRSPQKSVDEARKSPQKSVDEARKSPQKSVDEARRSNQKSVDEARKSPRKSVGETRKSPQKSVDEARKSPQKSVDEARRSPQKSVDEARKSPRKSVGETRKSPQKSVDEARKSPRKSVGETRKSPQKSVDKACNTPQKRVGETRKSPQKSVDKACNTPQKTVGETRKTPQKSVDEARRSPRKSVDEVRKTPQKSVDKARNTPQKTVGETRKTPQKSLAESLASLPQFSLQSPRRSPRSPASASRASMSSQGSISFPPRSPHRTQNAIITGSRTSENPSLLNSTAGARGKHSEDCVLEFEESSNETELSMQSSINMLVGEVLTRLDVSPKQASTASTDPCMDPDDTVESEHSIIAASQDVMKRKFSNFPRTKANLDITALIKGTLKARESQAVGKSAHGDAKVACDSNSIFVSVHKKSPSASVTNKVAEAQTNIVVDAVATNTESMRDSMSSNTSHEIDSYIESSEIMETCVVPPPANFKDVSIENGPDALFSPQREHSSFQLRSAKSLSSRRSTVSSPKSIRISPRRSNSYISEFQHRDALLSSPATEADSNSVQSSPSRMLRSSLNRDVITSKQVSSNDSVCSSLETSDNSVSQRAVTQPSITESNNSIVKSVTVTSRSNNDGEQASKQSFSSSSNRPHVNRNTFDSNEVPTFVRLLEEEWEDEDEFEINETTETHERSVPSTSSNRVLDVPSAMVLENNNDSFSLPGMSKSSVEKPGPSKKKHEKQLKIEDFLTSLQRKQHCIPVGSDILEEAKNQMMELLETQKKARAPVPKKMPVRHTAKQTKPKLWKTLPYNHHRDTFNHFSKRQYGRPVINKVSEVTETFFANLITDLMKLAEARHHRSIQSSDVVYLMEKQGLVDATDEGHSLMALVEEYLPIEEWPKLK